MNYKLFNSEMAFKHFMIDPTITNLLHIMSCLNDLREKDVDFNYADRRESMMRRAMDEIIPVRREVMCDIIQGLSLVNSTVFYPVDAKNDNPFSYSHSSTGLVTNSDLEKIKKWDYFIDKDYFKNGRFIPRIKKIIVNDQTTIVMWWDETKTIVRPTANDKFDLDAAVCAAIAKKLYGTNSALKRDIKKKVVYQESKKKKEEG